MISGLLQKLNPGAFGEVRFSSLFDGTRNRRFALPSRVTLPIAFVALALTALADYVTGFELDLSVLYLAPICLVAWNLGRIGGILFSVFAVAVWLVNADFTAHVLPHSFMAYPHSFFHIWKAGLLLVTWVVTVVLMDSLRTALARSDERFSTVLEGLHASVYVVDAETGEVLYLNQRCRDTFGGGGTLSHASQIESALQPGASGDQHSSQYFDGPRGRWYLIDTRRLRWIDGRSVLLKVATDITDRRRAEEIGRQQMEKLRQVSNLVTVGEMASTLAHEMNQPLAAIANYSMGCVRRMRTGQWDTQEVIAAMEKAGEQAERAGQIIQRVRDLVRKREATRMPCDVNRTIQDLMSLIEMDADKHAVRVDLDLASALPQVNADRIMLEQAILNIVRNAIEAMQDTVPGERVLVIRTRHAAERNAVDIDISDTGCGIPASLEDRSFEPFFTTKPGGLGMGLSICRSILEFHDGRIWASRNPGLGSTFHLNLPASGPWTNLPNPS